MARKVSPINHDEKALAALPEALRELRVWLRWRWGKVKSNGKRTKIPFYKNGNRRHGSLDTPAERARLVTFDEIIESFDPKLDAGVGIALGPLGDGRILSGIDLDGCMAEGHPDDRAQEIIAAGGYAELSPYGKGVHVLGWDEIGTQASDGSGLEIYSGERFFTVTGRAVKKSDLTSNKASAELARRLYKAKEPQTAAKKPAASAIDHNDLRSAIAWMPNKLDYGTWIKAGFGLRWELGESGRALWMEHSAKWPDYDEREASAKWESFKSARGEVTGLTILKLARDAGWKPGMMDDSVLGQIILRNAREIVLNPVPALWLLYPYLEQDVLAVMYGEQDTYKTFLALDWALHIAAGMRWHLGDEEIEPQPVIYISAEGRGLAKRVGAWVKHHYPNENADEALARLALFFGAERAINLSEPMLVTEFVDAIARTIPQGGRPVLIVIDTLTKNSSGVEESNTATQAFLNQVNAQLRMRYRATVLLIHHVGQQVKDRARGPYSLTANTDAEYLVERGGGMSIQLTVKRLKDTASPDPLELSAEIVRLGNDPNGREVSSLVLVGEYDARLVPDKEKKANARALYDVLLGAPNGEFTDAQLRGLVRGKVERTRIGEAIRSLVKGKWLLKGADGRYQFVRPKRTRACSYAGGTNR